MWLSLSGKRSVANIIGTFFTTINLAQFIAFLVFWGLGNSSLSLIFLGTSLGSNYLVTAVLAVYLINSYKKSDLFIIFYLFVFILVPFLGIFVYFLFGFDLIHSRSDKYSDIYLTYKKYEKDNISQDYLSSTEAISWRTLYYNFVKHKALIYKDVNVGILDDAIQILREVTKLVSEAKKFIFLEFYLFCDGLIFNYLFDLFKKKISEGVEIRLIVDSAGSWFRLSRKSIKRLKQIGVRLKIFNPMFKSRKMWWQYRNHNKLIVVDNKCALLGSWNIADEYFNVTNKYFQTTELCAKLLGPIVNSCTALFLSHWDLCEETKDRSLSSKYFQTEETYLPSKKSIAQLLDNTPISNGFIIKDNLVQLIFNAKKSIIISTPYFFPPKDLLNALKQASACGIKIKILLPKDPDFINFFKTLNRQLFPDLLNNNIEIYEYFGFNHEKVMLIDDEIVYFGSYNWDYRTLYLNFESALLIKCVSTAQSVKKFLDKQFKNSHRILKNDLKNSRNFVSIFLGSLIRLFKPFL